jgi:hypothetical protein
MERPGCRICGAKPVVHPRREDLPTSALTSAHKRQILVGTVKTSGEDRAQARTMKTAKEKSDPELNQEKSGIALLAQT